MSIRFMRFAALTFVVMGLVLIFVYREPVPGFASLIASTIYNVGATIISRLDGKGGLS